MRNKESHFFKDHEPVQRLDKYILLSLLISLLASILVVVFALQFEQIFSRYNFDDYILGQSAPADLIANQDILWLDEERTEKKRQEQEQAAPVVFRYDEEKTNTVLQKFEALTEYLWAKKKNNLEPKKELLYQNLGLNSLIPEKDYRLLLHLTDEELESLLLTAKSLLFEMMNNGIFSFAGVDRDIFKIQVVEMLRQTAGKTISNERLLDEIITHKSLSVWLNEKLSLLKLREVEARLLNSLLVSLATENCFFDLTASMLNRKKARESVAPVQEIIRKNYPIISKGQEVTPELLSKLKAFRSSLLANTANKIISTLLFLLVIYVLALLLFSKIFFAKLPSRGQALLLVILQFFYLVLCVVIFRLLPPNTNLPLALFLPTATLTVLVTILITPFAGIAFSLILSFSSLLIQNDLSSFLFAFLAGSLATALATRVQKRIDLIKASFVLCLGQGLLMCVISLFHFGALEHLTWQALLAAFNGFFSIIFSIGFLPLLEHLLNTPTRFRLMELSDINVPILKKMLVLAPGTYSHSINVANLAESAALAIGANALLARVGGYYHDIGKVDQPEYFIENQDSLNRHDFLKPSLSAAVIKSHVKIGVEKAKELDLPQEVIDVIAQHHGKGLISYFFHRARLENPTGEGVAPEDYSYQGKRPQSKEAALVMLADAVEAASRTLKKPTVAKIEKLVWQIIVERFHAEELLESELTLRELEVVKQIFVQIVQGYLHQRIEYPKTVSEAVK